MSQAVETLIDELVADARRSLPAGTMFEVRVKAPPHDCPEAASRDAAVKASGASWYAPAEIQHLEELARAPAHEARPSAEGYFLVLRVRH